MELIVILISACLLYILQDYLYQKFWDKKLTVNISFSKEAAVEGEELQLVETITNRKPLPLPILQVKFKTTKNFEFLDHVNAKVSDYYYRNDMLSVMMYQKITKTMPFICSKRGYYTVDRMDMIFSNLFLTSEQVMFSDLDICLYVYPKPIDNPRLDITFRKMLGTVLTKRFINEDPFEFRNIREYQSYDSIKAINWKASAKTNSLMVNVHDYTSSQQVKIFINVESETIWVYEDLLEESIRIASALSTAFINQGIAVSICTNAKDIITKSCQYVPAGSGGSHIKTIKETLARIDLSQTPASFITTLREELMNSSASDYHIIISSYQKEDLQKLMLEQLHSKLEFGWIIPTNHEVKVVVRDELAATVFPWEIEE